MDAREKRDAFAARLGDALGDEESSTDADREERSDTRGGGI